MATDTLTTLSSLLPSKVVTAEYLRLLADRNGALIRHPAFVYGGDGRGLGHVQISMRALGLDGYRILQSRAPGSLIAPRALDFDDFTCPVGPYSKAYEFDDLSRAILEGLINPTILARDAMMATANTLVSLAAQLVGGFANTSGTPGSALTAAQLLEAKSQLGVRNVEGPYVAVLSGVQFLHFEQSLATGTAGAIQWLAATAAMIQQYGTGYKGNWGGIDIFVSNRVPTTNGGVDHAGGMFGRGSIIWCNSSFAPESDPNIVDFGASDESGRNPVRFERVRTGLAGKTAFVTHANLGIVEGIDEAGESIITKATV